MTDNIVVEQETIIENEEGLVNLDEVTVDEVQDTPKDLIKEVEEDASAIPDKFKGKSVEDIVESYSNLEKEFGRKNNELGEQRKLIDQLLELKLEEKSTTSEKLEAQKVDVDTLLDDPDRVISDAVANNPLIKEVQENLKANAIKEAKDVFESKHSDWQDVVSSDSFAEWVTGSPIRTQMFKDANTNYKYDIADELLTLYKDIQGTVVKEAQETKEKNVKKVIKDAATEKGTSTGAKTKKVYSRKQLMELRLRDPSRYDAMSDEIYQAYAEGRVR